MEKRALQEIAHRYLDDWSRVVYHKNGGLSLGIFIKGCWVRQAMRETHQLFKLTARGEG